MVSRQQTRLLKDVKITAIDKVIATLDNSKISECLEQMCNGVGLLSFGVYRGLAIK